MVSASGNPGTAPSQPSFRAVSTRSSTSSGRMGRAASWTAITAASSPTSATPARTDSARVSPPDAQATTLVQASSSATRIDGSSQPGGATITIASTQTEDSRRSRLSASNGRSRSFANAFGRLPPSRSPRPAAAKTAQTDNELAPCEIAVCGIFLPAGSKRPNRQCRHGLQSASQATPLSGRRDLGRLLLRSAVGENAVEPFGRFVLVHFLGVHQFARKNLLRLDEHLLLAGRKTLLVVAKREVPDDLGELEDVAGLHLVAVVLEAPVPVLWHLRTAAGEGLQNLVDHRLVDHFSQADGVGVLGRDVHRHVVMQDLDRHVFPLLTEDCAGLLLHNGACSVVWIHHFVADLVQADPPFHRLHRQNADGVEPVGACWPVYLKLREKATISRDFRSAEKKPCSERPPVAGSQRQS